MQKMLCPFCDHVIKGKGKCDYCGSWVKKPVVAKTSAEFNAQASADPNQCDCSLHSPNEHPHDDTYRDSEDISYQADYNQAYGTEKTGGASVEPERKTASGNGGSGSVSAAAMAGSRMGAGQTGAPRRAVLASEAVEHGQTTIKTGGSKTVAKVVITIIAVNIILQILIMLFSLF